MKITRRIWAVAVIIFISASCVTTQEEKIKRIEEMKTKQRLGEAYLIERNYTQALKVFRDAEKLYPDDPQLQNDLGLTYIGKERYELAVGHFKKAIALKPDYSQAKNNIGKAYNDKKKWDMAIPYFKEAAEDLTYETPHFPLSNLGWAYYNKKDYRLAEQYYLKALRSQPRFVLALRGLALTYRETGRIPKAISTTEKAIGFAPPIPQLYFDLGELYTLSRDYEKALDAYGKVIELAPGSPLSEKAEKKISKLGRK